MSDIKQIYDYRDKGKIEKKKISDIFFEDVVGKPLDYDPYEDFVDDDDYRDFDDPDNMANIVCDKISDLIRERLDNDYYGDHPPISPRDFLIGIHYKKSCKDFMDYKDFMTLLSEVLEWNSFKWDEKASYKYCGTSCKKLYNITINDLWNWFDY